jgi:hypothetical protein
VFEVQKMIHSKQQENNKIPYSKSYRSLCNIRGNRHSRFPDLRRQPVPFIGGKMSREFVNIRSKVYGPLPDFEFFQIVHGLYF